MLRRKRYNGPTSNPYLDADNWIADCEAVEEWSIANSYRCKICDCSTYEVNSEYWYEIGDDVYCADCAEKYKFAKMLPKSDHNECSLCGYETSEEYDVTFFEFDGNVYCDDCLDAMLRDQKQDYEYLDEKALEESFY